MGLLVDVHAHLDHKAFSDDIDEVVERAREAGVAAILSAGINPETNRRTLEIAARYDIVKPALGIYPVDALKREASKGEFPIDTGEFDFEAELAFIEKNKAKILAVGEIGLDFVNPEKKEEQREHFAALLKLARKLDKPVIVHSRKAESNVIEMLEMESQKKVVLHCFSGSLWLIRKGIELGYYYSIPANIVFSSHFQGLARIAPISQLLTETDCPYLSPFKGIRNEPANIIEAVKKIAEVKDLTVEETANLIFQNYQRLFL